MNVVSEEKHYFEYKQNYCFRSPLPVCAGRQLQLRPDIVIWHLCLAVTQRRGQLSGRDDALLGRTDIRKTGQHLTVSGLGEGCLRIATCQSGHSSVKLWLRHAAYTLAFCGHWSFASAKWQLKFGYPNVVFHNQLPNSIRISIYTSIYTQP